jgi:hypothetical protein
MKKHVTDTHADILRKDSLFGCSTLQSKVLLILHNEEIFLYYKCCDVKPGAMYAAMQQVGITDSKYRYTVELQAPDEAVSKNITYSFRINSTSHSIRDIFDNRRCITLDGDRLKPFILNNELNMTVKLNEITSSRRRSDVTDVNHPAEDDGSGFSQEEKSDTDAEEKELEMSSRGTCPMSKIPRYTCTWAGTVGNLEQHVINAHAGVLWRGSVVGYTSLDADALLILFNKEIFLFHRYISKSGIMYATVQKVGITNKKYRYTLEATARDESGDGVTFNFRINKTSESFKDVFDTRKCVVIGAHKLRLFTKNNQLNMLLKIREVHKRIGTDVTEAGDTKGDNSTTSAEKETRDSDDDDDDEELDMNSTSRCPLDKIPDRACAWADTLHNLEEHVMLTHGEIVRRHPSFSCNTTKSNVLLILHHKEVFLYYKCVSDTGIMHAIVQQVGITNRKYRYTVVLGSADNSDNVTATFRISRTSRPFEVVFEAGKCLAVKGDRLERFIQNNEINMFLSIKEVITNGRSDVTEGEKTKTEIVATSHQEREREAPRELGACSTVICPLSKIPGRRCKWVGTLSRIGSHVTTAHAGIVRRCSVFSCGSFRNTVLLILFDQEIFLYYKHVSYTGIMYAVVQQVGVTNRGYRYTIELRAQDETVETVIFSFKTDKTTHPFEVVFDARTCMAMTDVSLEPFVVNEELNMKVKINEINIQSDRPIEVSEEDKTDGKESGGAHQEENADSKVEGDENKNSAVTCPMHKIPQDPCDWVGSLDDLEHHVIHVHARILKKASIFECSSPGNSFLLILFNKEIFLFCKHVSTSGFVYVIVQQVGITSEKYRYIVNFLGDDETGEIILSYDVNHVSEPFDTAFRTGTCLAIAQERVTPFIRGNQMLMAVRLERVLLTHAQEEDVDMNSIVTCPLVKVCEDICAWVGELRNLEDHVEDEHGDILCTDYVFSCNTLTNNALLLLLNKEIFLYYKYISHKGVMFVIVQQVGVTNRTYGYTVEFLENNEQGDICRSFTAYKITEPFQPIFDNGRCMAINMDSLGPYVRQGELSMSVGINEFRPSVTMDTDGCEPDYDYDAEKEEYVADLDVNTKCPLNKIPEESCPWTGTFSCLKKHIDNSHEDILKDCFSFTCNSLKDTTFLIPLNGEIFLYYKYFSHVGIMYAVVQQVGLSNKKYKYEIHITPKDGRTRPIQFTSIIDGVSVPFHEVFADRRCLVVSSERLQPLISQDEIEMFVLVLHLSP